MSNLELKGSELHFGDSGAKHVFSVANDKPVVHRFTEKGKELVVHDTATARAKLDAILTAAEKGDLHPPIRDFIEKNAHTFKVGLNTDAKHIDAKKITRIDKLKSAIGFAKEAEGLTSLDASEMKTLRAGLLEHGELGERLIDKETMKAAGIMGLEKAEIAALRADAKKLQELMKKPVSNDRLIKDLLTRNHANAPALLASVEGDLVKAFNTAHGMDLAKHVGELDDAISGAATSIKGVLNADNFKSLTDELKAAKANPTDKAAIVEAERNMNNALKEVRELTKTPEGKAAYSLVLKDKDFAEELAKARSAAPELAAHLDGTAKAAVSAATEAGKTAWGWSNTLAPKAEGIAGALWKNRGVGGKAAVIAGAGAVGYAIVSAIGGKGPGERAEAVMQSRDAEPAAGRA